MPFENIGLCGLHKEAVIVNAAVQLAAIVEDVFSHHRTVAHVVQIGQLLQYKIQVCFP